MKTTQVNYGFVILVTTVAAISGLLFGFDTGVISGALSFISATFHLTAHNTVMKEMIVSAVPMGALIGAVLSGKSANSLGRRRSVILSAILFVLGAAITAAAMHIMFVLLGRWIMGFAVGLSAMTVPMYLSEVAPPNVRGVAVFIFQLAITIGIMLAFVINYVFAGHAAWRMMFAVAIIPSVVLWVGMCFLPSSPRWLMLKGRDQEAKKTLARLSGDLADIEYHAIKDSISRPRSGLRELFSKRMLPLVIIAFGVFVFQQLTGINTIFYYAPTIFHSAGYVGTKGAILASVVTGVVNVLSTFVGIALVDRLGRRKLLFIGMSGMVVCLAALGLGYHHVFGANIEVLAMVAVLAFIFFFAISIAGCAYLIMSELFPLRLRAAGMATASCANWGFNILVSATFLSLIQSIGIGDTFFLYGGFTLIGLIFIAILLPETKGVRLERIEENLYAGKASRHLGI